MLKQHGIQKSHARENVLYHAVSCDLVHAPRDFELVGFHELALHNDS